MDIESFAAKVEEILDKYIPEYPDRVAAKQEVLRLVLETLRGGN